MQTNGQEQQQEPTRPTYSPAPLQDAIAAPALNPPGSATGLNAPIDAYLDAICVQMSDEVSAEAVEAMRREMRGHLEAAVVAHCELGQDEAEAVQSALAQFGLPKLVARQWQQEWMETLAEAKTASVWPSLKMALKTWAAVDVGVTALSIADVTLKLWPHEFTLLQERISTAIFTAILAGLPLLAGVMIGMRVRRRPLLCTLAGNLLLLPLLTIGFTGVNYWLCYYANQVSAKLYGVFVGHEFRDAVQSVIAILPTWIIFSLLGCTLVLIGRYIKKRARRQIVR